MEVKSGFEWDHVRADTKNNVPAKWETQINDTDNRAAPWSYAGQQPGEESYLTVCFQGSLCPGEHAKTAIIPH